MIENNTAKACGMETSKTSYENDDNNTAITPKKGYMNRWNLPKLDGN